MIHHLSDEREYKVTPASIFLKMTHCDDDDGDDDDGDDDDDDSSPG